MTTTSTLPDDRAWRVRRRSILQAANDLFVSRGFGATTMRELAARADCSVGYLYKHFPGKQEILDALTDEHMDVYEEIRTATRRDPALSPLDCLARELELMCRHMAEHRALIPVYAQRETEVNPGLRARIERLRAEDVALLQRARDRGEIPDLHPALLSAALDGAVWGLLKTLAPADRSEAFLQIPLFIDDLILQPLRRRARAQQKGADPR